MEGPRRKPRKILSVEKFGGYETEVKASMEVRERPALRKNSNEGKCS